MSTFFVQLFGFWIFWFFLGPPPFPLALPFPLAFGRLRLASTGTSAGLGMGPTAEACSNCRDGADMEEEMENEIAQGFDDHFADLLEYEHDIDGN